MLPKFVKLVFPISDFNHVLIVVINGFSVLCFVFLVLSFDYSFVVIWTGERYASVCRRCHFLIISESPRPERESGFNETWPLTFDSCKNGSVIQVVPT